MISRARRIGDTLSRHGPPWVLLFARIVIAHLFWVSGRTKVDGWRLRPETIDLFRDEYPLPFLPPEVAAPAAALAEHVLPVLLVLGLLSRLAAGGLAIMTLVIQLFVYPDAWWTHHALWLSILLVILVFGPGGISADALLFRRGRA